VEELIKRTQGMNTEVELRSFWRVWASDRKKRRIVYVNVVCDLLPTRLKLVLIVENYASLSSAL